VSTKELPVKVRELLLAISTASPTARNLLTDDHVTVRPRS